MNSQARYYQNAQNKLNPQSKLHLVQNPIRHHIRIIPMDAHYTKTTRPDPSSEGKTYSDHTLLKNTIHCCEQFKDFCKKFPSWSYELGRFTIIDSISYDSNTQTQINYCPFCGQKIKYKQVKS